MNPFVWLSALNLVFVTLLAAIVLWRNPRSLVTGAFGLTALCVFIIELGHLLSSLSSQLGVVIFWFRIALVGVCLLPVIGSLFSFILLQPQPRAMVRKRQGYFFLTGVVGLGFLSLVLADRLFSLSIQSGPAWLGDIRFTAWGRWFLIYVLLTTVIMLIALESTLRKLHHRGGRHALYGLMGALFYLVFLSSQGLLYSRIPPVAFLVGSAVITMASLLIAYDIVRHRLLQVEIYVGREAVYSSAILLLVGGYLVLMGLVAKLVKVIGGNLSMFFTILAAFVMLFLLVALLVSGSLKRRVKVFIDRNFYRGRYDYREQWLRFSEEMSSLVDLETILPRFLQMATDAVNSTGGCLLLPDQEEAAFEVAWAVGCPHLQLSIPRDSQFFDWLFVLGQPIHMADARFQRNPAPDVLSIRDRLKELGVVVLVPLVTKRKLVGLLALGPNRSGQIYSDVDLELLDAIGNHLSMAILNAKLSQELVVTRELEFIHKISSYVVHDLKNLVSSLSMLLQNAVGNMENAEFRRNMLVTIEGTVEKMKNLMGKIRTMPTDLELNLQPHDLNELVREVISKTKVHQLDHIRYVEELGVLPKASVDREYIDRILTNLIVNALEAMPENGTLRISTRVAEDGAGGRADGTGHPESARFVEIEVADTGVGMSQDFLRHKLFKPFQTTKPKGLGIGLYQCREAVEAHGGRILISSKSGEGTVCVIRLPLVHSIADR